MSSCTEIACDKEVYCRNLCKRHYHRFYMRKRRQDPEYRAKSNAYSRNLEKKRRYQRRYNASEKGDVARAKYRSSAAGRQHELEYSRKYDMSAARAVSKAKYRKTDKYRAKVARYKQQLKAATVPWSDIEAIRHLYRECPKGFAVDHVIPLNGKIVSGLHVLNNLQYLPRSENARKRNKFSSS